MSSELELMANSLFNNAVPEMWKGKASETQPLPTSRYRRVNNVAIATQCFLALCAAVVLSQNKPTPLPPPRPTRPWSLWPPGWRTCFRGLSSCRDGSLTAFHPSTGSAASSSLRLSSLEPSRITPGAPRTPSTPSDWTLRWVGDPDALCGTTATVMSLFWLEVILPLFRVEPCAKGGGGGYWQDRRFFMKAPSNSGAKSHCCWSLQKQWASSSCLVPLLLLGLLKWSYICRILLLLHRLKQKLLQYGLYNWLRTQMSEQDLRNMFFGSSLFFFVLFSFRWGSRRWQSWRRSQMWAATSTVCSWREHAGIARALSWLSPGPRSSTQKWLSSGWSQKPTESPRPPVSTSVPSTRPSHVPVSAHSNAQGHMSHGFFLGLD